MSEETRINEDYKEAFNLGYELAKELNLKSQIFKKLNSRNNRTSAMQAGMAQYDDELTKKLANENLWPLAIDKKSEINSNEDKGKQEGSGLNQSI